MMLNRGAVFDHITFQPLIDAGRAAWYDSFLIGSLDARQTDRLERDPA